MKKIDFYQYSDIGNREKNEDSLAIVNTVNGYVFAVADGLGGHDKGERASKSVCDSIEKYYMSRDIFTKTDIEELYSICQSQLYAEQEECNAVNAMRTTLSMVCIDDNSIFISHIGDSRVYIYKEGESLRRTRDHSVPQVLCDVGEIKEEDIRFHEDRNKLTNVLGVKDQDPRVDVEDIIPRTDGIKILICSDGFWENINEKSMIDIFAASNTAQEALSSMIAVVKENGRNKKMDNNTAIVIFT